MGRPRKNAAGADQAGELDITEETIEDSSPTESRRSRRPSHKNVLDQTGKAIADAGADFLTAATSTGRPGHGLQRAEAQSITTPLVRMAGRRVPKMLKKFAPKTKLSPEDAADLEEIVLTITKYALRMVMILMAEWIANKEQPGEKQQKEVIQNRPAAPAAPVAPVPAAPADEFVNEQGVARIGVSSGGHNPVFAPLGRDFGFAETA